MTTEPHTLAAHIAATVKQLRRERGWSLTRAAEATGVSKAMLGQIERGESSPTIATLWRMASGFRVSFSSLFEAGSDAVTRPPQPPTWQDSAGMQAQVLFAYDPLLGFEMLAIELAPNCASESAPHAPGVVEHIVVIEGTMALRIDDAWQTVTAGQGVRFAADRPHVMRNEGDTPLRFHDVIHYLPCAALTEADK